MATKKDLQQILEKIAAITGEATSEKDAQEKGRQSYLKLDYVAVYGGYRVVNVNYLSGYSESGAFGGSGIEKRLSANLMRNKLINILNGLEIAQTLEKK